MANDYNKGVHQKVIREKLNAEKVKLWLPPYTTDGGEKGDNPEELIQRYSSELNLSCAVVMETIESLRQHALQKLAEKKKYQESGLALLKVKVSGVPSTPDGTQNTTKKTRVETVEIPLSASGKDLYHSVSARISLPPEQLKMICEGHIINMTLTLFEQNVKHGAQIMCLCLSATEAEVARKQEEFAQMMSTRHAAELLSRKVEKGDDDDFEIQIADQSGRPLQLPPEEKKALTLAMTLHEKGRVALKRKEIAKSLLLLLEADKEFRKCRADILQAVDNYAVLCLDIVWCYLCLKNVEDLPDADQRLRASEECFKRSYGDNMERVRAVKGGSGTELALFMKLHLLQGIVAFHKHETENAHRLLALAKEELGHLQVDEDKLTEVMALGYTEREARLGLRASAGNIPQAVQDIIQKKEEKEQISKKVKEERRKKRTQKMLGKTSNGQMVNVDNYEMLTGMGFCKGAAAEALRQANNDINMALEVLQLHPDLLNLPDPTPQNLQITDDMIAQVVAMGFNLEMARLALKQQSGNIQHAIDELIKKGGIIIPSPNGGSSSSTSDSSPEQEDAASRAETKQQKEKEKEVLRDLVSDLPEDEEDYLDLKLNEEAEFLQEYITLLESVSHK